MIKVQHNFEKKNLLEGEVLELLLGDVTVAVLIERGYQSLYQRRAAALGLDAVGWWGSSGARAFSKSNPFNQAASQR